MIKRSVLENMDDLATFERFVSLAKRELGATDVQILPLAEVPPDGANIVVTRLNDGRHVVATFDAEPKERDVLARRLGMLGTTFADALAAKSMPLRARPPVVSSLHEELKALAVRARASDVAVIDIDSPVLWGCASVAASPRARPDVLLREVSGRDVAGRHGDDIDDFPEEAVTGLTPTPAKVAADAAPRESEAKIVAALQAVPAQVVTGVIELPRIDRKGKRPSEPATPEESTQQMSDDAPEEPEATRLVVAAIRRMPELGELHKGRHLRHVETGALNYLVMSFSGIYLLCLVFDAPFDELRAERAAHESLERIERLVLALPPLDPGPEPMGGVVAMRRPRRR